MILIVILVNGLLLVVARMIYLAGDREPKPWELDACDGCGYDLSITNSNCPECGLDQSLRPERELFRKLRWRKASYAVVGAVVAIDVLASFVLFIAMMHNP